MFTLIWRTIKDRKWSLLTYNFFGLIFLWMFVGLYPSFGKEAEAFQEAFQAYPEDLFKAFGIDSSEMMFSSLENFLAVENFSIMWPILVIAMFVSWGGSAIAGEVEKGTAEVLLAQPLSRLTIFISKFITGILALVVFSAITVYAAIPLAQIYDVEYNLSSYNHTFVLCLLFATFVYSMSIFFSSLFSEKSRAYFISAGIVIVMYIINLISTFKESLADLKYTSIFYYYDFNAALIDHTISNESYLVFGIASVVFTLAAAFWFWKRDIAV